jgi:hypothetical protein
MSSGTDTVSLPPGVAARGEPKQVVNLVGGKISGPRLLLVALCCTAFLACLVIAIPLYTGVKIVAVLRFTLDEWGEKKLYLESVTQVGDAARILQDALGQDFRAEAMQVACV